MKTSNPFSQNLCKKMLLITCIAVLSNGLKVNAQSSSAGGGTGNSYAVLKFLGWGTTSGDLLFKTNDITRLTLKNTTGFFGIGLGPGAPNPNPPSMLSIGTSWQFQVNSTGNLIRINNVQYSFPSSPGAIGTVLTYNASGNLTWSAVWSATGNAGIIDGTHFIGTTTNVPLNFRVNNIKAGRIDPAGPVFLGYQAGNSNTALNNTGIGYYALLSNTTGNFNTANGGEVLRANTTGYENTANGFAALAANITGFYNSANGNNALTANTTGFLNTANGYNALYLNATGAYNTASGSRALFSNSTGRYNTALGYGADVSSGALTNATAIGYNAKVSTSNSLVLGGTGGDTVNVGIGTTAPSARLEVVGTIKIKDGTEGPGKVLTSDANGKASWAPAPVGVNPGDMYYWNGSAWIRIPVGSHGQTLTVCNGIPRWGPCVPTITTTAATTSCAYETGNLGYSGGNITYDGGSPVITRGVCWSTAPSPDTADSKTINGTGDGIFASTLPGVTVTTTYYVRAYAINSAGISYGNEVTFTVPIAIGYSYQGGIIAYLLQPGDAGYNASVPHGLIAEPLNPATRCDWSAMWGCGGQAVPGAHGTAIGTGKTNTDAIIAACSVEGFNIAATYCYNLVIDGFSDWYLPSKDELNALYINRFAIGTVHPHCSQYWSSSEYNSEYVWMQHYFGGSPGTMEKIVTGSFNTGPSILQVRAVRSF